MNLKNKNELLHFFSLLLENEKINQKADKIIKFFIITRNYGLINLKHNIKRLYYDNDFNELIAEVIKEGFNKDNIPYTSGNIINFLISNYYEMGFYYHTFPGTNIDQINENGIKKEDEIVLKTILKYRLEKYFNPYHNIITMTDYLSGHQSLNFQLNEMKTIMQNNKHYKESDYEIIKDYYNRNVIKNDIGIAFMRKRDAKEYFGDYLNLSNLNVLLDFTNSCNMTDKDIIYFLTDTLSRNNLSTPKDIPREKISTIRYKVIDKEKEKSKTR